MNTNYKAPYSKRPTAANLKSEYSTPTNDPRPGDLVFFNFDRGNSINHVGIFISLSNDRLTWADASGWGGYNKVLDIRTRSLSELRTQNKFKGFGTMNLRRK